MDYSTLLTYSTLLGVNKFAMVMLGRTFVLFVLQASIDASLLRMKDLPRTNNVLVDAICEWLETLLAFVSNILINLFVIFVFVLVHFVACADLIYWSHMTFSDINL